VALNVAQYERIAAAATVPRLVDELRLAARFCRCVLAWLKRAETTLRTIASQRFADCVLPRDPHRCDAWRAEQGNRIRGRATPRKIQEATASMVLERANELLHVVIARGKPLPRGERISRQLLTIAEAKA